MRARIAEVQKVIADALNALPGVFSTVQWGGRAYKLPGPGGSRRKPKLLAHVYLTKAGDSVCAAFKLEKSRAARVIDEHDFIQPHSFRTLAPSGWVSAEASAIKQAKVIAKLLKESRSQFPIAEADGSGASKKPRRSEKGNAASGAVAARLDRVLREKAADGWSPREADGFE